METINHQTNEKQKPTLSKDTIIIILVVAIATLVIIFYFVPKKQPVEVSYPNEQNNTSSVKNEVKNATDESGQLQQAPGDEKQKAEDTTLNNPLIPVELVKNQYSNQISLEVYSSVFQDFTKSYSYTLNGYFHINGVEVTEMKMKIRAFDSHSKPIIEKDVEVISKNSCTFRNGDQVAINFLEYVETTMPEFKKVEILITSLISTNAPYTYDKSPMAELVWEIPKPTNIDLEVRTRVNSLSNWNTWVSHKLVFEVTNTGKTIIKILKFRIDWMDKNNKIMDSKDIYGTIESYSPIKIQQTRIVFGTYSLKENLSNFKNYKINVVAIE